MITLQPHALSALSQPRVPFYASLVQAQSHHMGGLHSDVASSTSLLALPNPFSSLNSAPKLMSMASGIRGGAAAKVALDMAKENHHLAVLSTYGVVTVLVLNSALRLYTSTKFKRDTTKKNEWVLPTLFSIFSGTCVITGAFTGVMFQLLGIYHRSALAGGNGVGYIAFKEATASFLQLGFRTFLTCLGSFVVTFLISFRNMIGEDDRIGNRIFTVMAGLALLGAIVLKKVLDLATVHIFTPMM